MIYRNLVPMSTVAILTVALSVASLLLFFRRTPNEALLWLVLCLSLGLLVSRAYQMPRKQLVDIDFRLQALETQIKKELPLGRDSKAIPAIPVNVPQTKSSHQPSPSPAKKLANQSTCSPNGQRFVNDHFPKPVDKMARILKACERITSLRIKPELPTLPWELGAISHKGHVRSENQDYVLAFLIGGRQAIVVADGCGGHPRGGRAAYLAAVTAARSIIKTCGAPSYYSFDPQVVAALALHDASDRLAKEGAILHLTTPKDGLRTTLIVVVAENASVGYAYCGDGGACIVRTNGVIEHFLNPQKASAIQPNVLAASLGPMRHGEPATGLVHRSPGDLIVVGTDGIFDRVKSTFPNDVFHAAIRFGGNLNETAKSIVEELISIQDEAGYICDDNATLAIAGDGTATNRFESAQPDDRADESALLPNDDLIPIGDIFNA